MIWETIVRKLARRSSTFTASSGSAFIALLLVFFCQAGMAQQTEPGANLPDAPSTTQTHAGRKHAAPPNAPSVPLLAGKSRIFPNLAVTTKPLTSEQKFGLFARNSVSGLTIIGSAMGAGISQARNTESGYGQGAEGYGKRFGASMAFASSSNLFGTFMIASLLNEDPRYFVKNSPSFKESVKYSVSRIFVTRMDDGTEGANWAGMIGPLGAAALANTYLPADSQGVGNTFSRWGIALAVTAGTNLLREYWPRINKKLRLPNMGLTPPATVQPPPAAPTPAPAPNAASPPPQSL